MDIATLVWFLLIAGLFVLLGISLMLAYRTPACHCEMKPARIGNDMYWYCEDCGSLEYIGDLRDHDRSFDFKVFEDFIRKGKTEA